MTLVALPRRIAETPAQKLVRESAEDDQRDPLALDVTGRARTVQLRIPITHIADTKHHLELIAAETLALAAELGRASEKDQTLLLGVKLRLHRLNGAINAYRGVGRKW